MEEVHYLQSEYEIQKYEAGKGKKTNSTFTARTNVHVEKKNRISRYVTSTASFSVLMFFPVNNLKHKQTITTAAK